MVLTAKDLWYLHLYIYSPVSSLKWGTAFETVPRNHWHFSLSLIAMKGPRRRCALWHQAAVQPNLGGAYEARQLPSWRILISVETIRWIPHTSRIIAENPPFFFPGIKTPFSTSHRQDDFWSASRAFPAFLDHRKGYKKPTNQTGNKERVNKNAQVWELRCIMWNTLRQKCIFLQLVTSPRVFLKKMHL